MKMQNVLGLAIASLSVVACDPITGYLNAPQGLEYTQPASSSVVRSCRRRPNQTQCAGLNAQGQYVRTLAPGSYETKLEPSSKKQLNLNVKVGRNNVKIALAIPSGVRIPENEGTLALTGAQTGQPFDIAGSVTTEVRNTEPTRAVESCSVSYPYEACEIRTDNEGRPYRNYVTRSDTVHGDQDVEYYIHYSTRRADITLTRAGATVATFSGTDPDSDRIYTFKSECRTPPPPRRWREEGCRDWHRGDGRGDRDRPRQGEGRGDNDGRRGDGDHGRGDGRRDGDGHRGGGDRERPRQGEGRGDRG